MLTKQWHANTPQNNQNIHETLQPVENQLTSKSHQQLLLEMVIF